MYLGDKWECLFGHAEHGIRAFSPTKLEPGKYWLQLPADKLWVY
jgi:iron(III) transport system ATP-binding protein